MAKCTICNEEIILVPSAAERAAKSQHLDGHPASYYTKLFTTHDKCAIEKRNKDTSDLMRKINWENEL